MGFMKQRILKYRFITGICLALFAMTSCDSWLDVKPKTEVEAEDLFKTQDGFKEALAGVYTSMNATSLYGRELTFGMLDAVAQQWNITAEDNSHTYYDAVNYDYESTSIRPKVDTMWSNMYKTIAYANNILKYVDEKNVFTGDNQQIIKGEALAIRAYVHFDLLRLFCKNGVSTSDEDGIPYISEISKLVTKSVSPKQVIDNVIADLETAAECLAKDPILTGREVSTDDDHGYLLNRQYHLNYYAVQGLMARVYMYAGNTTEARKKAMLVIKAHDEQEKFPWVKSDDVTADKEMRDRTFASEHLFALNNKKLIDNIKGYFTSTDKPLMVRIPTSELFPVSEFRSYAFDDIANLPMKLAQYNGKFVAGVGTVYPKRDRMPMIRLSEMYYIMAECDKAEPTTAVGWLNTVLTARGYEASSLLKPSEVNVEDEILKEFQREFICEGQLFFYHKRKGTSSLNNKEVKYVFPKPETELEFGK